MIIDILKFYIRCVVQLYERVLNGFQVVEGVGFGTFLLASALIVAFIGLLKFQLSSNGFETIRSYRERKFLTEGINAKHSKGNNSVNGYYPMHSKHSGRFR